MNLNHVLLNKKSIQELIEIFKTHINDMLDLVIQGDTENKSGQLTFNIYQDSVPELEKKKVLSEKDYKKILHQSFSRRFNDPSGGLI